MVKSSLLVIVFLFPLIHSLYFYTSPNQIKCFYEDLAQGNVLIGDIDLSIEKETNIFIDDPSLELEIIIYETFDNDHQVFYQKNSRLNDFIFTALGTGEHRICIRPKFLQTSVRVKVDMDMNINHIKSLESNKESSIRSLKDRIYQLTHKLEKIRIEQKVIREKEARFRDQSESANSKIFFWSLLQIAALIGVCIFQLRYLKNFFVKQKIV